MKMLLLEVSADRENKIANISTRAVEFPESMSSMDRLYEYYRMLNCRCIDIREVFINDKPFDLIVDDEGLLVENPVPTFYLEDEDSAIAGNILFAHCDEEGETVGLDDEEIPMLQGYLSENIEKLKKWMHSLQRE